METEQAEKTLAQVKDEHFLLVLMATNWHRNETAKVLGICVRSLRDWINKQIADHGSMAEFIKFRSPGGKKTIDKKPVKDPFECSNFPTNEERLEYRDYMLNADRTNRKYM